MNIKAMERDWNTWCSTVTRKEGLTVPMFGNPFAECWRAAWTASYKARQVRRPLEVQRIRELVTLVNGYDQDWFIEFARLIERQHDIKEDK